MNNKDFLTALGSRLDIPAAEAKQLTEAFINAMADHLDEGAALAVQGFGTFEIKKKLERIVVNPTTKQRQLVPPKLAVSFKPSPVLKEKIR
ncbi:MAG: HU family DNA-binding protein [Alloprevotella sp.]